MSEDLLKKFLKKAKQEKDLFEQNKEIIDTNTNVDDRVLLVDGTNLFIRSFSANPKLDYNGNHIGGTTGTLRTIAMLCERYKFTRVVLVFDGRGGSQRRKKILPSYKSGRAFSQKLTRVPYLDERSPLAIRENSVREMAQFGEFVQLLPFQLMIYDSIEGDDVIGYLASKVIPNMDNNEIMICTGDKDYFQLINDKTKIYYLPTKKIYDNDRVKDEFKCTPQNFIYYKAILGDTSDDIKGIKGIGPKTIQDKLSHILLTGKEDINGFNEFYDLIMNEKLMLETLLQNGTKIDKRYGNLIQKIVDNKDVLKTNYEVMDLRDSKYISGSTKSNIRDSYRNFIPKFDFNLFKREFMNRGYYNGLGHIDNWIYNSFSSLIGISKNTKKIQKNK